MLVVAGGGGMAGLTPWDFLWGVLFWAAAFGLGLAVAGAFLLYLYARLRGDGWAEAAATSARLDALEARLGRYLRETGDHERWAALELRDRARDARR